VWLESYSASIESIQAEEDLRLFHLLSYIFPARSDEEVKLREKFVKLVGNEMNVAKPRQKEMSFGEMVSRVAMDGIPIEVVRGQSPDKPIS
jgi:hypothetical protein